ncbi:hypothetical protein ACQ4PT_048690 [Festuca glaucescens]
MSDPTAHGFQRAKPVDKEPAGRSGKPLSGGVIAAIVLAVVVVVVLLAVGAFCFHRWRKKRRAQPTALPTRARVSAQTALVRAQTSASGDRAQGQIAPPSSQETEATPEHLVDVEGCGICHRAYDDAPPQVLECRHGFHPRCIRRWLEINLSCPIMTTRRCKCWSADAVGDRDMDGREEADEVVELTALDPEGDRGTDRIKRIPERRFTQK